MKKKLAIVLCLILSLSMLAGCSSAELGYLKMSEEIMGHSVYDISGDCELSYDADAVKEYLAEVLTDEADKKEMAEALAGFTGTKKIGLSYTGEMDMSSGDVRFMYDLTAVVDGVRLPVGKLSYSVMDGIFVEKDMPYNLMMIAQAVLPSEKDAYYTTDAYKNDLKAAMGTQDYIALVDMKELLGQDMPQMMPKDFDYNDVSKEAFKFLTDAFSGYSTGMVTEVSGGYKLTMTGESALQMVSDSLGYIADNLDTVVPAYITYMKAVAAAIGEDAGGLDQSQAMDIATKAIVSGVLKNVKSEFDTMVKDGDLDALKPFTYESAIRKSGDSYLSEEVVSLTVKGRTALSVSGTSRTTPKSVSSAKYVASGSSLGQVGKSIAAVENKYNPALSVTVTWDKTKNPAAENSCKVVFEKKEASVLGENTSVSRSRQRTLNQQIYLPMRMICEGLGEEVGWDNAAKQAYVMKDGERIVMNGVLDGGTTYIKVRDFEKLGYAVSYDGGQAGYHEAKVMRK